jgi:hypothetical protein
VGGHVHREGKVPQSAHLAAVVRRREALGERREAERGERREERGERQAPIWYIRKNLRPAVHSVHTVTGTVNSGRSAVSQTTRYNPALLTSCAVCKGRQAWSDLRGAQREHRGSHDNDSAMYVMATRRAVGWPANLARGAHGAELSTESRTQRSNHGVAPGESPWLTRGNPL